MKQVQLALIGILLFSQVAAQKTFSIGIHGNTGNKSFDGNGGYGADLTFMIPAGPNGAVRLYGAYDRFPKALIFVGGSGSEAVSLIPLHAGYHQYLYSDNVFLYGEAGISAVRHPSDNKIGFSYAFGTGYKLNLPKSKLLQFTLSYQHNGYQSNLDYSWFQLGVAYGFKFGQRKTYRRD